MTMKKIYRIITLTAVLALSAIANAGMVAITINDEEEDAIAKHKAAGAKVQVIEVKDRNYPTVIRAVYKDDVATYLVTDAIPIGDTRVSRQVIVSRNVDALRGLGTWFNKQPDYKIVEADKWKTEVDGDPIVIYFEPVNNYSQGIIIEKERNK